MRLAVLLLERIRLGKHLMTFLQKLAQTLLLIVDIPALVAFIIRF